MRDFTRITWSSEVARLEWEPLFQQASEAWLDTELLAVRKGVKPNALVFGKARVVASGLPYVEVSDDRFAVGPRAELLAEAFCLGNDEVVGQLLGFPVCCREFFANTWAKGTLDTTSQMEGQGRGPITANILGRWLGLRWVSHLPCSFTCAASIAIGNRMRDLLREKDKDSADTIDEVLSWPIEWSALHGIAEVKYPVCKLTTRTGYTPAKVLVRREGTRYPKAGARGLGFPYRSQPGSAAPLEFRKPLHTENGFTTTAAMDTCHMMVLSVLAQLGDVDHVMDLGCGNGILIDKIGTKAWGIECDASKIHGHSRILHGNLTNIRSVLEGYATQVFIVSQRRFEEIPTLEAWLRASGCRTIVYSYDEPRFARIL